MIEKDRVRCTVYIDTDLHRALRIKSAHGRCTISGLVNDAIRRSLAEDRDDLAVFDERVAEPTMTYEALLEDLRKHGKI